MKRSISFLNLGFLGMSLWAATSQSIEAFAGSKPSTTCEFMLKPTRHWMRLEGMSAEFYAFQFDVFFGHLRENRRPLGTEPESGYSVFEEVRTRAMDVASTERWELSAYDRPMINVMLSLIPVNLAKIDRTGISNSDYQKLVEAQRLVIAMPGRWKSYGQGVKLKYYDTNLALAEELTTPDLLPDFHPEKIKDARMQSTLKNLNPSWSVFYESPQRMGSTLEHVGKKMKIYVRDGNKWKIFKGRFMGHINKSMDLPVLSMKSGQRVYDVVIPIGGDQEFKMLVKD